MFFWKIGGNRILASISPVFKNKNIKETRSDFERDVTKQGKKNKHK
jgi:hypothetical protein